MITVVADDITGAAEIAGVCLRYGLKVSFGIDSVPDAEKDVCVITTDSRSSTEDEAYNIHKTLAKEIFKTQESVVFKKCDSVLRGFVLTELAAFMEVTGKRSFLLQPANPATGRSIQEGNYYIGPEKIEYTGFSKDPDFPSASSEVRTLLLQRSTYQSYIPEIYTGLITDINKEGVFVPDCSSVEELQDCCELINDRTLLCGSAAFFEQFLIFRKAGSQKVTQGQLNITSNFLMICGSAHPQSHKFIDRMSLADCPVHYFPTALLQEKVASDIIESWTKELIEIWSKHRKLILSISQEKIEFPNSPSILKNRMNQVVAGILKKSEVEELLIEGGATAYGILNLLNWKTLTPVQELLPGVVRMQVSNHPFCYLTIKPGSYSWPEELLFEST